MNEANPLISVIVAAYNCELHIKQCLESIIDQTERNIEILVVNDGSTDNTLDICNRFASKDKRITVISSDNKGVSCARNKALRVAKGEFISFVDADDYIDNTLYSKAYKIIHNSSADLLIWNFSFCEGDAVSGNNDFPEKSILEDEDGINSLIATTLCPTINLIRTPTDIFLGAGFVWNKLFKRSVIADNGISFLEGLSINEDVAFVVDYLHYCSSVRMINSSLYNYRVISTGATLKYKPELPSNNRLLLNHLSAICDNRPNIVRMAYYGRTIRCIAMLLKFYIFHKNNHRDKLKLVKSIVISDDNYVKAVWLVNKSILTAKQRFIVTWLKLLTIRRKGDY